MPEVLYDVPASIQPWITNLVNRVFTPMITFSIVLLVIGIILLVVSFAYSKKEQTQPTAS